MYGWTQEAGKSCQFADLGQSWTFDDAKDWRVVVSGEAARAANAALGLPRAVCCLVMGMGLAGWRLEVLQAEWIAGSQAP
jgi:hypothetical protein